MEIPVECCPQHHGNLPSWAGWSFEVVGVWERDGADEESVILEGWLGISVNLMRWFRSSFSFVRGTLIGLCWLCRDVFFRLQNDGPARWEDGTAVNILVIGLKEQASEDRLDCQALAVWKVDDLGSCHIRDLLDVVLLAVRSECARCAKEGIPFSSRAHHCFSCPTTQCFNLATILS